MGKIIAINDLMQSDYRYELVAPIGEDFDNDVDRCNAKQYCTGLMTHEGFNYFFLFFGLSILSSPRP